MFQNHEWIKENFTLRDIPMHFEVTTYEKFISMVLIPNSNNHYEITICQVLVEYHRKLSSIILKGF